MQFTNQAVSGRIGNCRLGGHSRRFLCLPPVKVPPCARSAYGHGCGRHVPQPLATFSPYSSLLSPSRRSAQMFGHRQVHPPATLQERLCARRGLIDAEAAVMGFYIGSWHGSAGSVVGRRQTGSPALTDATVLPSASRVLSMQRYTTHATLGPDLVGWY